MAMGAAVLGLVCADQLTKAAAVAWLKGADPVVVVPELFNLAYVENRGCAWGMLQGHVWPLALFAFAVLALLVWKRKAVFPAGRWGLAAETMLYAGVVGNLLDRVFRGRVVDMLDFHWGVHHFPVFNVADSFITLAAAILIAFGFLADAKAKKSKSQKRRT